MILLGYCSQCKAPVWAMHKDAGAIEKECKHPVEAIAWLPHMTAIQAEKKSPTK